MNDIFISYAREDVAFVRQLSQAFKDHSRSVWVDLEGLHAGEEYWPWICQAIAESGVFLFVISPDSARSEFCRREIDRAVELHKRIVPVLYRDVSTEKLYEPIAKRQWQILRQTEDLAQEMDALIHAIAVDATLIRAHTYWLNKATQWDDKGRDHDLLLRGKELREAQDWLAQASQHPEPQPTQLQAYYITTSRNAAVERARRNRWLTRIIGSVFALLTLFASWQWRSAEQQRQEAVQSATAERHAKDEADMQRRRALARQLLTQVEVQRSQRRADWQFFSTSLAIEAVRLFQSPEIEQALHHGTALVPCATYKAGTPIIAISPDGTLLLSAGYDCTASLTSFDAPQPVTRLHHQASVAQVSFSRDGHYIATVTHSGAACLWNANSGNQLFCLPMERQVSAVTFSADSKYIAVASYLNTAWLWKLSGCHSVDCPPSAQFAHDSGVHTIVFHPNDSLLITASWDNTVRLWNIARCLETVCQPSTILPHDGVTQAVVSPDGKYLATIGYDPLIHLWEVASCTSTSCQQVVPPLRHDSMVTAIAFSPDGSMLASAGWDRKARLWGIPTGQPLAQFSHDLGVSAVAFSPDGQSLATGSYDRRACVWVIATGQQVSCLHHETPVTGVTFHPDGQQIVTASYDSVAHLWRPFHATATERAHVAPTQTVTTSAGGEYVATVSQDQADTHLTEITLWQYNSQRRIGHFSHHTEIAKLAVSRDGQYIAAGGWDNIAELWKLDNTQKQTLAQVSHDSSITALALSPDGTYLATGGWTGSVRVWADTRCHHGSCQPIVLPTSLNSGITALAFSPDNNTLLVAGWNNTAQVWDLTRNPPQLRSTATASTSACPDHTTTSQTSGIAAVAFNSSGQRFATASYDHSARVWDLRGQQQHCFTDANGFIAVAFDATDTHLATATWDKTVRFWNIATQRETTRLRTEEGITALTFDGRNKLLTTGWDNVVQQWTWKREERLAEACKSLQGRTLSKDQWKQYLGTEEPYESICVPR